eukprot:TRINITY_DN48317_c0_g1_i1.p1 TRINITY_DN48317_c0_g1~~TRINITY_DN48317_c0_g1_i1.p1  ORF type:complete len:557 (-),score=112.63 TRINITY_DN48317_c0_g1_i1:154-1824(-)
MVAAEEGAPAKRQRVESGNELPKVGVLAGKEASLLSTNMDHVIAKPQDVNHVVFHGRCPDGFCGAYAAWLALGSRATYVGIGHGTREDKAKACGDVTGKSVAVVDFSFDAETTKEHLAAAASYVVLDHHASAQSCLKDVPAANKVFEMKQSGATLAWDFWHAGKECPPLLRYIEDKDIWRWAMHSSKEFSAVFELEVPLPESGPVTCEHFAVLDKLVKGGEAALVTMMQKGAAVLQFQNQVVEQHKQRAVLRRLKAFPDLVAAVVNSTVLPSEIGNAATQIDGANFALVYSAQADGSGFNISARSCFPAEGQSDVSAIAKHFGGGGHKAASGFRVKGETLEAIFAPYDPEDTVPGAKEAMAELRRYATGSAQDPLEFKPGLSAAVRRMLHEAAEKLGLKHESVGNGDERILRVTRGPTNGTAKGAAAANAAKRPDAEQITRKGTADPRMSQIVEHNGLVYLSGQVPEIDKLDQSDCRAQVEQTLAKVDMLLKQAGTSKSRILSAQLWLKDIGRDFQTMNEVWNGWVDPDNKPARACTQAEMAKPSILFEAMIVAAK